MSKITKTQEELEADFLRSTYNTIAWKNAGALMKNGKEVLVSDLTIEEAIKLLTEEDYFVVAFSL